MALARYQFHVLDDAGNVMPNASVEVRREATGSPIVSLFSDRDGATPLGNPFNADTDGYAAFHVAGGAYKITATLGDLTRVFRYVGIGLASETDALSNGIQWLFSTATTDADPGAGNIRFNNATLGSVTTLYIDNASAAGLDMTGYLDSLDDGGNSLDRGIITLLAANGNAALIARVTGSVVNGTGYRKVSVTVLASAGAFVSGIGVNVTFGRAGVDGVIGGTTGGTDNAVLRADGTGGTTAQASGVTIDDSDNLGGVARIGLNDTNASHELRVVAGSDLTAHRTLTLTTGDANRTLTLNGDITPAGQGKQTIWIPAGAMKARASNGAGIGSYDSGTEDVSLATLDFDTTTQEYAHFSIAMPKSWNESTVTAQFLWTNTGGASAETVRWSIAGIAISDDDGLNVARGTAVTVDDTWLAQNDLHISAETSAITIGGTPAEGDLVVFEVTRVVASDNMAGDARLIGVRLFYTTNAATDA